MGFACALPALAGGSGVSRKLRLARYSSRAMGITSLELPSLPGERRTSVRRWRDAGASAPADLRPPRAVLRRPRAPAFARSLVSAHALEARLPQPAVLRPFAERHLGHQPRLHPVDLGAVGRVALVKGGCRLLQLAEPAAQVQQQVLGVPGADLAGVDQPLAVVAVVADQQRPQADARPL